MPEASPLWPARLHHLEITTPRPEAMADFYARVFGYRRAALEEGRLLLRAGERRLLLREGAARGLGVAGFAMGSAAQLEALRGHVTERGARPEAADTPLLGADAFALRDPDGRALAFGLPAGPGAEAPMPEEPAGAPGGRLQHVVVTTLDLAATQRFYADVVGFVLSDRVVREADGALTTVFYRSDPEHHSIAAFLSDSVRLDHHALDVPDWNAIRDWADHFAALEEPIIWGPGRHGPGNNVFCMVADPDGNMVEISAELERMPRGMAPRQWPHNERSLNLWGPAIMRI